MPSLCVGAGNTALQQGTCIRKYSGGIEVRRDVPVSMVQE